MQQVLAQAEHILCLEPTFPLELVKLLCVAVMLEQPGVPRSMWSPKWWAGGYTWDNFKPTDPPVKVPVS